MFKAKGYGKKRSIILATPRVVAKEDTQKSEKEILEEPKPTATGKILTEEVEVKEDPVIEPEEEVVAPVEEVIAEPEVIEPEVVEEEKPKKTTKKTTSKTTKKTTKKS